MLGHSAISDSAVSEGVRYVYTAVVAEVSKRKPYLWQRGSRLGNSFKKSGHL